MEENTHIIITNKRGWQKQDVLPEGVHLVGKALDAQINLDDEEDIAPYHLQIVNAPNDLGLRLINLASTDVLYEKNDQKLLLSPSQILDVFGTETLNIGSYTLRFQIEKSLVATEAVHEEKARVLGLRFILPDNVLRPNTTLTGTLHMQNLGREACQFEIELEGFPAGCYEISPPPLIFAGGEETTEIYFFHKKTAPAAGYYTFTMRVAAPDVYPGEMIEIRQNLRVLPNYEHALSFITLEKPGTAPSPEEATEEPETFQEEEAVETQPDMATRKEVTEPAATVPVVVPEEPVSAQPAHRPVEPEPEAPKPMQVPAQAKKPAKAQVPEPSPQEPVPVKTKTRKKPQTPAEEIVELASEAETLDEIPQEPVEEEVPPTETPPEPEPPSAPPPPVSGRRKRIDLSSVKVMKASTGDFLEEKEDEE